MNNRIAFIVSLLALLPQQNVAFVVTKPSFQTTGNVGGNSLFNLDDNNNNDNSYSGTQLHLFRRFRRNVPQVEVVGLDDDNNDEQLVIPKKSSSSKIRRMKRKIATAVMAGALAVGGLRSASQPAHAGLKLAMTKSGVSISAPQYQASLSPDLVPATVGDALSASLAQKQSANVDAASMETPVAAGQVVAVEDEEGHTEEVVIQEMSEQAKMVCAGIGAAVVIGGQAAIVKKINEDEEFMNNLDKEIERLEEESAFVETLLEKNEADLKAMAADDDDDEEEPTMVEETTTPVMEEEEEDLPETVMTSEEDEADKLLQEAQEKVQQSLRELREIEKLSQGTTAEEPVNGAKVNGEVVSNVAAFPTHVGL